MSLEDDSREAMAQLRALAHPLRLRVLSLLTGASMTAAEVARELDLTHANASYHLRQLHAVGIIQLESEERIRGGAARRFCYDPVRDASYQSPVPETVIRQRWPLYDVVAGELRRRSRHLRPTPGRAHLTDAELWVDPDVYQQIRSQVESASLDLHRAAQPARSPGTILVNATLALFEMDPSEPSGVDT